MLKERVKQRASRSAGRSRGVSVVTEVEVIINKIRENLPIIRDKYKVKTIGLFGSYIRCEQKKRSDVDILVEFKEPISLLEFMALERELSKFIGKKVDLVMKTTLKSMIGKNILREVMYI